MKAWVSNNDLFTWSVYFKGKRIQTFSFFGAEKRARRLAMLLNDLLGE